MKQANDTHASTQHGSYLSYTIGFILSIALTLAAYFLVVEKILTGTQLMLAIVSLAVVQLLVQLVFFLHLGRESSPRWNQMVFWFAAGVVLIVVIGSIWIMENLDYNMMPKEMEQHMLDQTKKGGF